MRDKRIIGRSKMDQECDIEGSDNLSSNQDNSMDKSCLFGKTVDSRTVLTRSESMPVLKNASSTEEDNDEGRVVPTSESSLARQRKMKLIVTRMGPLLSSESNLTVISSPYTSKADFTDENYEAKKLESRMELPVLQATLDELPSYSKEMTDREVSANEVSRSAERKRENSTNIDRVTKIAENPRVSLDDDDLIDIAENPHPSIKSFYFPPNPNPNPNPNLNSNPRGMETRSTHSRIKSRVAKDLDTLLRIDGELGPLRHKLNEITGKFRAMSLAVPSLSSQERYSVRSGQSPSMSGYYLGRTETFGRDSRVDNDVQPAVPGFAVAGNSGWQAGTTYSFDRRSFRPYDIEPVPFSRDRDSLPLEKRASRSANVANEKPCWSKCTDRDASNDSCCVTWNNSRVQFEARLGENPSGFSLIPSVSSSCYKCYRNRVDQSKSRTPRIFDELEAGRWNSSFAKRDADAVSFGEEPRSDASIDTVSVYSRPSIRTNFVSIGYRDTEKSRNPVSDKSGRASVRRSVSGSLSESLYAPSTSIAPEVRVVGTNTELCAIVDRYSGRIVGGGNTSFGQVGSPWLESSEDSKARENNRDCCYRPREEKVCFPLVSKTDRNVETSNLVQTKSAATGSSTHLIANNENHSSNETNKKRRDANVQCSGFDVTYRRRRKEMVVRRSVESFSRISESDDSNTSKSNSNKCTGIRVPKPAEKVVVVPIFFIDGLPEPPKLPLFKFTESTCYLPRTKHRLVQLEERTCSFTRSSLVSDTSIESLPMEAYLGDKFTTNREQYDSGMSFSCVSRNGSSYPHDKHPSRRSNTANAPSERYRSYDKSIRPGSMLSSASASGSCSESTKKETKKIIRGMQSTPEDFLCDT